MFREVLARLPDLRLADAADLPIRASNFVSGHESMPVRFRPTPAAA
jgi:cholest-4-en-3-one 26-monooxygenase